MYYIIKTTNVMLGTDLYWVVNVDIKTQDIGALLYGHDTVYLQTESPEAAKQVEKLLNSVELEKALNTLNIKIENIVKY